jgi:glycosyltransferase involved in cell wall biosynthesis
MANAANMRPRVAILTNYAYDERQLLSGVETATEGLLEGLINHQSEFDFHIVALSRDIGKNVVEERNGFRFHYVRIPQSFLERPRTLFNIVNAIREIRSLEANLIHCQDNLALAVAAVRAGQADLFTVHGLKVEEGLKWRGEEYWSHQMDRVLERYVHSKFRAFVAVSSYSANVLRSDRKIFRIPNPLSRRWFRSDSGQPAALRKILCVSSYNRLKRQDLLLRAIEQMRSELQGVQVVMCGTVDDKRFFEELQKFAATHDLPNVVFNVDVPRDELAQMYSDGTLLIHPSEQENTPMAIAEAMARGTPIIASKVGGIPEMIQDGVHGLLFSANSCEELVARIRELAPNAAFRQQLGQRAHVRARELYDPAMVGSMIVEAYRVLLRDKTGR